MPAKPTKYGVKLFSCCHADTGYCLRLVVYCGRESRFVDGEGFFLILLIICYHVTCYLIIFVILIIFIRQLN